MVAIKFITSMKLIILTFILYTVFTGLAGANEYKLQLEITLQPKRVDKQEEGRGDYYFIMYHKDDVRKKKSLKHVDNEIIEVSSVNLGLGKLEKYNKELSVDDQSPLTLVLEILENDKEKYDCLGALKGYQDRHAEKMGEYDYMGYHEIVFDEFGLCSIIAEAESGDEVHITIEVNQTKVVFNHDFINQVDQFPDAIKKNAKISKPVSASNDISGTDEKISLDKVRTFTANFNGMSFLVNDGYDGKDYKYAPEYYSVLPKSYGIDLGQENVYIIRAYYKTDHGVFIDYDISVSKENIIYDETVKIIRNYTRSTEDTYAPLLLVYDNEGQYLGNQNLLSKRNSTRSQGQQYVYISIDSDLNNKLNSNGFRFKADIHDLHGKYIDTVGIASTHVQNPQNIIKLSLPAGGGLYSSQDKQSRLDIRLSHKDGKEQHAAQIYNVFYEFIQDGEYKGSPLFKVKLKERNELDFRVRLEKNGDPIKVRFDSQDTSSRLINFTPADKVHTSHVNTKMIKELYTSFTNKTKIYIKYFVYEKTETDYKVIDSYIVFDLTKAPRQMAVFSLSEPGSKIKLKGWSVNNKTLVTDNEGSIQLATLYDEFKRNNETIILYPPAENTKYASSDFSDKFSKSEASNFKKGYNFDNPLKYREVTISPTDFEGFCPTVLVRVHSGGNTDTLVKFVTSAASFDPHYGGDNNPGKIYILKNGDWKPYNNKSYSVELRNIESIEPIGLNSLARTIINQKNHKQLIDTLEQKKPEEWIGFFTRVNGIDIKLMDSPKAKNHNLSFVIVDESRGNKTIPLLESHVSSLFKGMKFSDEEVSFIENSNATCYIADGGDRLKLKLEKSMFYTYQNNSFSPPLQDIVIHLVIVNADRPYDDLQYLWSRVKSPLATALNSVRQNIGNKQADINVYILHYYESTFRCKLLEKFSLPYYIDDKSRSLIMKHLIDIQFINRSGIGMHTILNQIEETIKELKGSLDTTKHNYLGVITYGDDDKKRISDNTKRMNNSEPISFSKICSVNGIDGIVITKDYKEPSKLKNELIELFKSFFDKLLSE